MSLNGSYAADYCCSNVERDDGSQNSVGDGGSFISEGADDVLTMSLCNNHHEDVTYAVVDELLISRASNLSQVPPEISLENDAHTANIYNYKNGGKSEQEEGTDASSGTPKGKSIAHKHLEVGKVVFLSFDVETGRDLCGIIQLLCQIFRIALTATTTSTPKMITTDEDLFNKYVKP
mmetsp:Transcript_2671/g.5720  ORF Transcript_2671/g.5720 Transcript_2671/m.5720 type:complete len:177 (+) Transcript_2671:166-696(+)